MILTDTHTHLYYERDPEKRKLLIDRCLENGVSRLFLPNVDPESVDMIREVIADYPEYCFPMLGLHPCEVKEDFQKALDTIRRNAGEQKFYAIGEIGIDLYWDKSTLEYQREAFRTQIHWAKSFGLPIVIHCREAFNEVYTILKEEAGNRLRGIFHCFSGTVEQANLITEAGFYLGIGGVLTYKNAGLDKVAAELDLKNIVLETDSPYLPPVPFRGKPNESSYLVYIARKLAELKNISLEEVAEITTNNSKSIFGI